jgi:hypothetical protein
MIEEKVVYFHFNKKTPKPPLTKSPNMPMVSVQRLHDKRPRGLNKNLEVVFHHILWNKGERRNV